MPAMIISNVKCRIKGWGKETDTQIAYFKVELVI